MMLEYWIMPAETLIRNGEKIIYPVRLDFNHAFKDGTWTIEELIAEQAKNAEHREIMAKVAEFIVISN